MRGNTRRSGSRNGAVSWYSSGMAGDCGFSHESNAIRIVIQMMRFSAHLMTVITATSSSVGSMGTSPAGSTPATRTNRITNTTAARNAATMLAQSIVFAAGRILRRGKTSQLVACITALDTGLYGGMRTTCIQARNSVKIVLSRKRAISLNISNPFHGKSAALMAARGDTRASEAAAENRPASSSSSATYCQSASGANVADLHDRRNSVRVVVNDVRGEGFRMGRDRGREGIDGI